MIPVYLDGLPNDNLITPIAGETARVRGMIWMHNMTRHCSTVWPQSQLPFSCMRVRLFIRAWIQVSTPHTAQHVRVAPLRGVPARGGVDLVSCCAEIAGGEILEEDPHARNGGCDERVVHFDLEVDHQHHIRP